MVFAPVGIRCPDHGSVGAPRPSATRTVRQARGTISSTGAPVTTVLIAINVLVYLITVGQGGGIGSPGGRLFVDGALYGPVVADGDWWRLFTAMFLHASLLHIAFNMLALWWFGSVVERSVGTLRYILIYVASGLAGSAGALIASPNAVTVGASGAIFGLLGALLVLEYLQTGSFALALTRYRTPRYLGPALVVVVGAISVAVAVARVRGYA
jgi:membrane associated rhomboid family serine protease